MATFRVGNHQLFVFESVLQETPQAIRLPNALRIEELMPASILHGSMRAECARRLAKLAVLRIFRHCMEQMQKAMAMVLTDDIYDMVRIPEGASMSGGSAAARATPATQRTAITTERVRAARRILQELNNEKAFRI